MSAAPGILHVVSELGDRCRYCGELFYDYEKDRGLRCDPGTRVEVYAIGSVVEGYKTTRPLDARAGSECEPCWEVQSR